MIKTATTLDEQIQLLKKRGLDIQDDEKAKECLLDIGYYRLGAYLFPFEKSFPNIDNRTHEFKLGSKFYDAVTLYYLDFDLRNILSRYLSRIEVDFRTFITYEISNKYKKSPTWFADPKIVGTKFISKLNTKLYKDIRKQPTIARHHKKYINDRYAPAWKTLEYMTFGSILFLYLNLKTPQDKIKISKHFGVNQTGVFENYMQTIKTLRNACAHGSCIYDLNLPLSVKNGPAGTIPRDCRNKLIAALMVTEYLLGQISANRLKDMKDAINKTINDADKKSHSIRLIINEVSGGKLI